MEMMLDTGASWSSVKVDSCTSGCEKGHFHEKLSKSFKSSLNTYQIQYGGLKTDGVESTDSVKLLSGKEM